MKKKLIAIFFLVSSICYAHKEKWDDDKSDWTPLMLAIYNNQTETIDKLIAKGVDVTYRIKTNWKLNALDIAIFQSNAVAVKKLIQTGKFLKLDYYLDAACNQQNVHIVEFLIDRGANAKDENGVYSKLMSACSFGSAEIVECLLRNGAEVNNYREVDGITALMLATFNGKLDIVKLLLKYSADKYQRDRNGKMALDYVEMIYKRMNTNDDEKDQLRTLLR